MIAPDEQQLPFVVIDAAASLPGHVLQVTGAERVEHGVQLRYTITPAVEDSRHLWWDWAAADSNGNGYLPAGGAYGPSPAGDCTRGSLSVMPLPLDDAARMTFEFTLDDVREPANSRCVVAIDLTPANQRP